MSVDRKGLTWSSVCLLCALSPGGVDRWVLGARPAAFVALVLLLALLGGERGRREPDRDRLCGVCVSVFRPSGCRQERERETLARSLARSRESLERESLERENRARVVCVCACVRACVRVGPSPKDPRVKRFKKTRIAGRPRDGGGDEDPGMLLHAPVLQHLRVAVPGRVARRTQEVVREREGDGELGDRGERRRARRRRHRAWRAATDSGSPLIFFH